MNISRTTRNLGRSLLAVAAVGGLAAAVAAIRPSAQTASTAAAVGRSAPGKAVLYAAVGPELTQYELDLDAATLTRRGSLTLPGFVTEAGLHPSKKYLYVVWGGFPGGGNHGLSAFRIDPASGGLLPHGQPVAMPASPGYISAVTTDIPGQHVIASDSDPSRLAVYRLAPDGTIGAEVTSTPPLDFGIHAHQVRMDPSNRTVILVARGNGPTAGKPEEPGGVKIFGYKDGVLTNRQSVAENGGFNFQPRHMDFHPSGRWDFVTLERQNKLLVYQRMKDGTIGSKPLFTKETLTEPGNIRPGQIVGTVHVHPNGRFVYLANRASGTTMFEGTRVFVGGENSIAVFSINQSTGEPTLIQNADTRGMHPRTFSFDPSMRILVAGNIQPLSVRDGNGVHVVPASLSVFRIGGDGKLEFVRKYDVDVGGSQMFWVGFIPLPR